jgi:hypothetical protein
MAESPSATSLATRDRCPVCGTVTTADLPAPHGDCLMARYVCPEDGQRWFTGWSLRALGCDPR